MLKTSFIGLTDSQQARVTELVNTHGRHAGMVVELTRDMSRLFEWNLPKSLGVARAVVSAHARVVANAQYKGKASATYTVSDAAKVTYTKAMSEAMGPATTSAIALLHTVGWLNDASKHGASIGTAKPTDAWCETVPAAEIGE